MSDSTDNTNELDSYGVWVKRPGSTEDNSSDSLDIDAAFDIPDFSDEEIIVEETPAEEIEIPEVSSDEIDLSGFDIPVEETTEEPAEEIIEETAVFEEEPVFEETVIEPVEETVTEEELSLDDFELPEEDGEISLDEFMDGGFSDESVASGNNGFAPGEEPVATEDVSADFMSDGEISLDDFLDGGDFTSSPSPEVKPQAEDIVDEKPLEMDISFDNEVDTIETEDNIQTEESFDEDDSFVSDETESFVSDGASHSTEIFGDTEEIDLSDFGIDADAEETPITQNVEESKQKDVVVDFDLSVSDEKFASAPVVTEIKDEEPAEEVKTEEIVQETIVPAAPAPQVEAPVSNASTELLQQIIDELSGMKAEINALKSNLEQIQSQKSEAPVSEGPVIEESIVDEPVVEEAIIPEATEEESAGFFDNIDGDDTIALSGDELDNMLNNVEINEAEEPVVEETIIEESEPTVEETSVEEPVVEETVIEENEPVIEETIVEDTIIEETVPDEIEIPETTEEDTTGFFDDTDGDDTIALSGDELDNMLNNVEISESEESVIEETIKEEPVAEEITEEPVVEETIETEELDDIPEEIDIEPVSTDTIDDDIFGSVEDTFGAEETETIEINEDEGVPESDAVMEEPDLDDIVIEDESGEEELPEEITIPKVDDILVESANNDFMDSVTDSTDEENEKVNDFDEFMSKDPSAEESLTESNIDYLSEEEIPDDELSAPEKDPLDEAIDMFPSVDDSFDDITVEAEDAEIEEPETEEIISETEVEEPIIEEPALEEPVIEEETIVEEEPVESIEETSVEESEVETTVETPVVETPSPALEPQEEVNDSLKKDIKSVLLYMDQLLENLPEEKIVEFAKSDEFATYKKLFSELGLA